MDVVLSEWKEGYIAKNDCRLGCSDGQQERRKGCMFGGWMVMRLKRVAESSHLSGLHWL